MQITRAWLQRWATPGGGGALALSKLGGPVDQGVGQTAIGPVNLGASGLVRRMIGIADPGITPATSATFQLQRSATGGAPWTSVGSPLTVPANDWGMTGELTISQPFVRALIDVNGSPGEDLIVSAGLLEGGGGSSPLDGLSVGLFESLIDAGLDTLIGDVTRPDGAPGALVAISAFSDPIELTDGSLGMDANAASWRPAGAGEATTVKGWFLAAAGPPVVLFGWQDFPSDVPLPSTSSSVSVVARVAIPNSPRWGSARSY